MTPFKPLSQVLRRMNQRWQDLPLATKGIILNALPLTVLIGSLALIFKNDQQAAILESKVQNTLMIQQDIQTLQTQLLEASTGVRDFLLTGNRQFLKGYERAIHAMPLLLDSLETKLDTESLKQLTEVANPLVQKNLDDLATLANNTDTEANDALIHKFSSQGAALNQLKEVLTQMSAHDSEILILDKQKIIQERRLNFRITLLAVVIGVLGSLLGVWVFSNTIVARVKTIRDNAIQMVQGKVLVLASTSRDELGQLTKELEHASQLLTNSAHDAHQARIEAEEASTAKSNFLSRTSHELRTPLNAILGFAQILENDLPEGRQKDSASLIHNAGQHLLKLINEVLDISRIERGDISLSLEVIALNPLLEEAYHYIRPLGKVRDIVIECEFAPALFVRADRQRLLQVILNLLANALKYGPENAQVVFRAYQQAQEIRVEILDQGKGIPTELRSRLFTPFDRLGAERTMTEGTGLGLVLSKQLMTAMGGNIGVAETQSLFWISLPACTAAELPAHMTITSQPLDPSPTASTTSRGYKKYHMLYVEDHASNRALMEAVMSKHRDFKLHLANSVQEGLIWLRDMTPDLLLIDLNLPDGSGEQLIRHVKSQPSLQAVPVIVLSADALPETITRTQALGITHYFTKPVNIAAFNQLLHRLF